MKIGIINITTLLSFLLLSIVGIWGLYVTILSFEQDFHWELCIALFIFVVFVLALLYLLIFKFRIVKIDSKGIECFYPFLWKTKSIKWEKQLTCVIWDIHIDRYQTYYRIVSLKTGKQKEEIKLSDFEFENFRALTDYIPDAQKNRKAIDLKKAKSETGWVKLDVLLTVCVVAWLVYVVFYLGKSDWVLVGSLFCAVTFLFIFIKRAVVYSRIVATHTKKRKHI
ncbi:MAG: hypothetical protein KGV44_09375 [Flavobacteriaceae bacterium]|nr:hypothetical protein [Flavobacteriaceae bacterium]